MLSIPSPAGKDDSDFGLCTLSILTEKGDEMDNISAHTPTPTHTKTSARGVALSMTSWGWEQGWWS